MSNKGVNRCHIAAYGVYVVACANVAFITVAFAVAPSQKVTLLNTVTIILANALLTLLLIWLARGVRRCRRIPGAMLVLMFMLFGHGMVVAVSLKGGYLGSPGLAASHVLLALALLVALGLLLRAQMQIDAHQRRNAARAPGVVSIDE